MINGCVVCPWHGYEYATDSGASPPPFNEQVPTFNVRVSDGQVWVDPKPNPPGTQVEPATTADPSLTETMPAEPSSELYIGYKERAPAAVARSTRKLVIATVTAATVIATLLVALQTPFANSNFAYGTIESFEGQLLAAPYPLLTLSAPEERRRDLPRGHQLGGRSSPALPLAATLHAAVDQQFEPVVGSATR